MGHGHLALERVQKFGGGPAVDFSQVSKDHLSFCYEVLNLKKNEKMKWKENLIRFYSLKKKKLKKNERGHK